jgi:DNA-binding transcriptional regulator GbsR (MarR family)
MEEAKIIQEARSRLIETGGSVAQDLGFGRIVGQILVHLYLQRDECSLDAIAEDLRLSKASVSIAVRQLEQLGLARRVWKSGDKRNFYKSADNIGKALQQGLLALVRQKVQIFGDALEASLDLIQTLSEDTFARDDLAFLQQRIKRAQKLQNGLEKVLENPVMRFISGARKQ